ncbi:MAG TPA: preprotein translocase subunit YajC [Actinomycetota bacterium]|nr:preprotein translocase subunit YajC [Actinomycetota bacterium]
MFLTILAQTVTPSTSPSSSSGTSGLLSFLPLILIFGLFYAFMIRPQRQRQRRQQALLQELAVGDEVQTTAGMFGTVIQLSDEFAWVELAPGTTIKMLRRAVMGKVTPPQEEESEKGIAE